MELVQKIQLSATKLFNKFGVRSVSMDEISKELNISKKTLYKCFRDKDELVRLAVITHLKEIELKIVEIRSTEPHPIHQLYQICQFVISKSSSMNPNMMRDLRKYHREIFDMLMEIRNENFTNSTVNNIELGRSLGYYRNDFDVAVIANSFNVLTYTIFDPAEFKLFHVEPQQALSEIVKYHIRGIATPLGLEELSKLNWN